MVLINQFINFKIGGVTVAANSTELNYNATVTAGTAAANKTLVLDSSKDIFGINHLSANQLSGTIQTASQPNITSLGQLSYLDVGGTVRIGDTSGANNGVFRLTKSNGWLYMQTGFNTSTGSSTHFFITDYNSSVFSTNKLFSIMSDGRVGIQTYSPGRQCEINSSTGSNLRLTYNDKDGSAVNYADFLTDNSGNLTITTSGEFTTITKKLKLNNILNNFNTGGLIIRTLSADATFRGRTIKKEIWTSEFNIVNYDPEGLTDNYSFSVYGYIKPLYSQTYTFYIEADDEIRLWVNGELLFVDWQGGNTSEQTAGTISLSANIWYPIYIEFVENTGGQKLVVRWSSTSQTKQIIQTANMAWDDEEPAVKHNFSIGDKLTLFNRDSTTKVSGKIEIPSNGRMGFTTSGESFRFYNKLVCQQSAFELYFQTFDVASFNTGFRIGMYNPYGSQNVAFIDGYKEANNFTCSLRFHTQSASGTLSEKMVIKDNGKVGIGVAEPSSIFHVFQASSTDRLALFENNQVGGTGYIDIQNEAGTRCLLGAGGSGWAGSTSDVNIANWTIGGDLVLFSNRSEKMRIDSSGNIGIGTSSPSELLHLRSTGPIFLKIEADSDNSNEADVAGIELTQDGGGLVSKIQTLGLTDIPYTSPGESVLSNALAIGCTGFGGGAIYMATEDVVRMSIKNNGDIGIGTVNPTKKLDVRGDVIFGTTGSSHTLELKSTAAHLKIYSFTDGVSYFQSQGNMYFGANSINSTSSPDIYINTSGNVGIGDNSPSYKLDVNGDCNIVGDLYINNIVSMPTISKDVDLTSGYINSRFYPIALRRSYASSNDIDFAPVIEFQVGGESLSGGDLYNENTLYGFARGGGWTDHQPMSEVTVRKHSSSEYRILGIYEGTSSFTNGIVIYVRGGYKYSFTTNADDILIGTSTTALTISASTFAIKDQNNNDVVGTSANIYQLQSLIVPDGKHIYNQTFFNDNVGIQTTGPSKALEVNDSSGNCLRLTYNDNNGGASNYCDFNMSSSGDIFINPSGGDINLNGGCWIQDGSSNTQMIIGSYGRAFENSEYSFLAAEHTGGLRKISLGMNDNSKAQIYIEMRHNNNAHNDVFMTFNTTSDDQVSATEKMRLTHNGRLGIGTSAPENNLHVKNDGFHQLKLETSSASSGATMQFDTPSSSWQMGVKGASSSPNDAFYIYNNNYRFVIEPAGNIGMGTSNPATNLDIQESGSNAELRVLRTDSNGVSLQLKSQDNKARITYEGGNGPLYFDKNQSGSTVLSLGGTGNVGINTNSGLSILHIKSANQSSNTGALRIEDFDNTNNWSINFDSFDNLEFRYNNIQYAYLRDGVDVDYLDFTGQHRSSTDNNDINTNIDKYIGLIVSATGEYKNINNGDLQINEALPKVDLSKKNKDKRVYGVISNREDENDNRIYEQGNFVTTIKKNEGDERLIINSIGEGMIWVCNKDGEFENGDLITSSDAAGYGTKQDNEFICNYTVGKITQDCNFDIPDRYIDENGQESDETNYTYKCCFVGCVYYCG